MGVTILGYLFYAYAIAGPIFGILVIFGMGELLGVAVPFPGDKLDWAINILGGLVSIILGPFYFAIGFGLLKLRPTARKKAVVLLIVNLAVSTITSVVWAFLIPSQLGERLVSVGIYGAIEPLLFIIIIRYLQKPSTKQYFAS